MEDLKQLDWDLMLILNDWGNDTVDLIFNIITYKYYAIPLYLYLLFLLYKKLSTRDLVIALCTIAILVAASDQLAVLFKNTWIQRYRPFKEPALDGLISKVGESGGTYGFYSGHASNAMALAVYLWHMFKKSHKTLVILLFVWAVAVAYSRVYLGVHYPGDVLMGMFMGSIIGWLCYRLYAFAKAKYTPSTSP